MEIEIKIEHSALSEMLNELMSFKNVLERLPQTVFDRLLCTMQSLFFCDFSSAFRTDSVGEIVVVVSEDFKLLIAALSARNAHSIGDVELIAHIESLCEKYHC
ncbi:hypothetical protein [Avibacterium volantium]|uniref:hypothetical protein n=1 Tax=Avibacterium volantium TaxID=762 RepID=UPI003BF8FBCF